MGRARVGPREDLHAAVASLLHTGGGTIELAPGRYAITRPLVLSSGPKGHCVSLRGSGSSPLHRGEPGALGDAATVLVNNGDGHAIVIDSSGCCSIENLAIVDGMQPHLTSVSTETIGTPRTRGAAIYCSGDPDRSIGPYPAGVVRVRLSGVSTQGHVYGVYAANAITSHFDSVLTQSASECGFRFDGGTSITMTACYSRAAGRVYTDGVPVSESSSGYQLGGVSYSTLMSCASDYSHGNGYRFTKAGTLWCTSLSLSACGAEGCGGTGFEFDSVRAGHVAACRSVLCGTGFGARACYSLLVDAPHAARCTLGYVSREQTQMQVVYRHATAEECGDDHNWPVPGDRGVNNGLLEQTHSAYRVPRLRLAGDDWQDATLRYDVATKKLMLSRPGEPDAPVALS